MEIRSAQAFTFRVQDVKFLVISDSERDAKARLTRHLVFLGARPTSYLALIRTEKIGYRTLSMVSIDAGGEDYPLACSLSAYAAEPEELFTNLCDRSEKLRCEITALDLEMGPVKLIVRQISPPNMLKVLWRLEVPWHVYTVHEFPNRIARGKISIMNGTVREYSIQHFLRVKPCEKK